MSNLDAIRGRSTVLSLTNTSGGTRSPGDIVVIDTGADESFTTSTSSNTRVPIGVVDETIGIGSNGRVVVEGYARFVKTVGTSARGDYLFHSTTTATAAHMAGTEALPGSFGYVLDGGAATATTAYIFPTAPSAGSSLSLGSNSTDVTSTSGLGGATTYSPSTHFHKGVSSVSHSSNTFVGGITLIAQGSVGITSPSSGTFAINAVAGAAAGGGTTTKYAILQDQKAQNTAGGTLTSGSWQTRVINTEVSDPDGIVTVASNQFTPISGTYVLSAWATARACDRHQARLYNATAASVVQVGTSGYSAQGGTGDNVASYIDARFTANGSDAYEIQHQGQTTAATNGLGVAANFTTEVYLSILLEKIA